ncbi:MAG: SDR family oxidoreductase [Cytophagales bacterium]|nr:SDR family oxidoreductase [Cytophagales bacterium]
MGAGRIVLVTGASGLLGGYLHRRWASQFRLVGTDRNAATPYYGQDDTQDLLRLDVTDREAVATLLHRLRPDVVVNCAAMTNVDRCEEEPQLAALINADAVGTLAEGCQAIGARLVHISTDAVFDGARDRPYTETDAPNPINAYGASKLLGEDRALSYHNSLVVRTNIFGWNVVRDKGSFGEWVLRVIVNNEAATMFSDVLFSPIYIGLFAKRLFNAIENDVLGLYHLAGSDVVSKEEFAREMARQLGRDHTRLRGGLLRDVPLKARRPHNMGLSSQAFRERTGATLPTASASIAAFLADEGDLRLSQLEGTHA